MAPSKAQIAREKEARRVARLTDREKLALEVRLVREGKIYPRAHYRPRGTFRAILAVALALFLGIFIALGGLIGAGVWLGTSRTTGQILELFGLKHATYSQYIYDEYSKLTVLGLVNDLLHQKFESIDDLAEYSPFVEKTVDTLIEKLDGLGVTLDKTTLMSTPFTKLDSYVQDEVIPGIRLGRVLNVDGNSHELLLALCYGEEGVDYEILPDNSIKILNEEAETTVGVLTEKDGMENTLNRINLGTMLGLHKNASVEGIKDNAVMYAIAYGKFKQDYDIDAEGRVHILNPEKTTSVGDLIENSGEVINGVELGSMLALDFDVTEESYEANTATYAICYGSRGTDYEIDEEGRVVMLETSERKPTTVKDLSEGANGLISGLEVEALLGKPDDKTSDLMYYVMYGASENYTKVYDESGHVIGVEMIAPNKKRTVESLKNDDFGDVKIKDIIDTEGDDVSPLVKSIADFTIGDLQNEEKTDSLKISDLFGGESDSMIMNAFAKRGTTLGDLKKQETIEDLRIEEIFDTKGSSSKLMAAIASWKISDLQNQKRIERLKLSQVLDITDGSSNIMNAMKDWRIGELTDQGKIDSLLLGDVLDLNAADTPALLKTLASCQIGELGERVDTLRLSEIMGEEQLEGNKILKHLKDSTIETLPDDIANLSIGEVFGEEMYSYMKIEDKELSLYDPKEGKVGAPQTYHITYDWLYKTYFGEAGSEERTLNQGQGPDKEKKINVTLYNYNYAQFNGLQDNGVSKDPSAFIFRPQAARIDLSQLTEKRVLVSDGVTEITEGYFLHGTSTPVEADKAVLYDAAAASYNAGLEDPAATRKPVYYYENEIKIVPSYEYRVFNYENDTVYPAQTLRNDAGTGKSYFTYTDGKEYEVLTDEFGDRYILVEVAPKEGSEYTPDPERVDLEEVLIGYYDTNGEKMEFATDDQSRISYKDQSLLIHHKAGADGYYYILEKIGVDKKFTNADKSATYEEDATKVLYFVGGEQYDRYVSGVWYLLLGQKNEHDGTISFKTETPILNVDSLVTGVSGSMQNTLLAELWFHGLIDENPYTDFSKIYPNGLEFTSDGKEEGRVVKNLIEVSLNETLGLVKALTNKIGGLGG